MHQTPSEMVHFIELLLVNSIQSNTLVHLLIEKGFFTEQEFLCNIE